MGWTVGHFIRKDTQIKASFIYNQVSNHNLFKPIIIYKTRSGKNDGGYGELKLDDFKSFRLSDKVFSGFMAKLRSLLSMPLNEPETRLIGNIVTEEKCKILHFHFGTDAGLFLPKLSRLAIPKIVSFYGYDYSGFPRRFFGLGKWYLKWRVFKHADLVLAMSENMKRELLKIGCPESKLHVHYYGTDVKKFYKKHDYNEESTIRFLIISGLVGQKGHLFLLEAFHKASMIKNNIRLTIVGKGPEKDKISAFISRHKMKNVTLKDFVVYGTSEHLNYFKDADVFIHPSVTEPNGDKEGIPGAIVEAMAAGLPVISTIHAGIPEVISHGKNGLLVDEWDIEDLKNRIVEISENSGLRERLGLQAQEYALKHLDLFSKEDELEGIYTDTIRKYEPYLK